MLLQLGHTFSHLRIICRHLFLECSFLLLKRYLLLFLLAHLSLQRSQLLLRLLLLSRRTLAQRVSLRRPIQMRLGNDIMLLLKLAETSLQLCALGPKLVLLRDVLLDFGLVFVGFGERLLGLGLRSRQLLAKRRLLLLSLVSARLLRPHLGLRRCQLLLCRR